MSSRGFPPNSGGEAAGALAAAGNFAWLTPALTAASTMIDASIVATFREGA